MCVPAWATRGRGAGACGLVRVWALDARVQAGLEWCPLWLPGGRAAMVGRPSACHSQVQQSGKVASSRPPACPPGFSPAPPPPPPRAAAPCTSSCATRASTATTSKWGAQRCGRGAPQPPRWQRPLHRTASRHRAARCEHLPFPLRAVPQWLRPACVCCPALPPTDTSRQRALPAQDKAARLLARTKFLSRTPHQPTAPPPCLSPSPLPTILPPPPRLPASSPAWSASPGATSAAPPRCAAGACPRRCGTRRTRCWQSWRRRRTC